MKICSRIAFLNFVALFVFSSSAFCLEGNSGQVERKKPQPNIAGYADQARKNLEFHKQRHMTAAKIMMGLSKDPLEQTAPDGTKMNTLQPSTAQDEFFLSIDKTACYADRVSMAESYLPKKKTK